MGGLNVMDVRREQIPLLWSTEGETALVRLKGFCSNNFTWGMQSICVYAEEWSFLEEVDMVRRWEKYAGDESEKKLWQIVYIL